MQERGTREWRAHRHTLLVCCDHLARNLEILTFAFALLLLFAVVHLLREAEGLLLSSELLRIKGGRLKTHIQVAFS